MTSKARDLADLLSDGAVGTNEIANGAVTEGKLGNGAVTESKLGNGAVTADKLAAGAVTVDKVPNSSITLNKLSTSGTPANTNFLRGDGQWITPPAGFSGAQSITSANNVTLTAQTPQTISVNITSAGRKVILPDATTLTAGGDVFRIYNSGTFAFDIETSTGATVQSNVAAFNAVGLTLVSNSTASGVWARASLSAPIRISAISSIIQESFTANHVVEIDTNRYIALQTGSPNTVRAGTLSNGVITWGNPVTFTNTESFATIRRVRPGVAVFFSSTIPFNGIGPTRAFIRSIAVSGNTITLSNEVTVHSFQQSGGYVGYSFWSLIEPGNITCAANAYNNTGVSPTWRTKVISVDSGGAISLSGDITGNAVQFFNGLQVAPGVGLFTTLNTSNSAQNGVAIISFSGTSHTVGSILTGSGAGVDGGFHIELGPFLSGGDRFYFAANANTIRERVSTWTISGTTVVSRTDVSALPQPIGDQLYLSSSAMLPTSKGSANTAMQLVLGSTLTSSSESPVAVPFGGFHFKLTENTAIVFNVSSSLRYYFAGVA